MTRRCAKFTEENLIYENYGCAFCDNFEWKEREPSVYNQETPDVEPHCKLGFALEHMVFKTRTRKGKRTPLGREPLPHEHTIIKRAETDVEHLTLEELQKLIEDRTPPPEPPKSKVPRGVVDWELLKKRVQVIPEWAGLSQDPTALTQHFGIYSNVGQIHLSCSSVGNTMHITFHWSSMDYGFTKDEEKKLLEMFEELGLKIETYWGGGEWISVRFFVEKIVGPHSLQSVYHRGCQKTGTYVSDTKKNAWARKEDEGKEVEHRTGSVFCECGWFGEGRGKVVFPEGWN